MCIRYEKQPFSCNTCGHTGHTARNCTAPKHEYKRNIDLNDIVVGMLDIHVEKPQKVFTCSECGFESTCEKVLTAHKAEHVSSYFLCSVCCFQTSTMLELESHSKEHTGENATDANKSVKSVQLSSKKLEKTDHKQSHKGEKPFMCNICQSDFFHRESLEQHSQIHLDEILFKCNECEYECRNKDVMVNNQKTKHSLFTCNKCDYQVKSEKAFTKHFKLHIAKDTKCTGSNKTFTSVVISNSPTKVNADNDNAQKLYSEIVKSPVRERSDSVSNSQKRGLSLSPELLDPKNIHMNLRSNNNTNIKKKPKN